MPDLVPAGARVRVGDINNRAPVLITYEAISSSTAGTISTSAQAAITTDPITLRTGRAFRISYRGGMTSTTSGQQGTVLVTRGAAGGSTLLNSQRIPGPTGQAGTVGFYFENIVVNQTGTDITTVLVGTYQMVYQQGSGTIGIFASSTTPAYVEVVDVGPAGDYPSATPL
ncbi:hypothetical protein ACWCXE_20990 [Streptomyces sp. NPDC001780]